MRLTFLCLLAASLAVAGCDQDVKHSEALVRARRNVIDRPQLWSIHAVGQAGKAVRLCTDATLRTGFIRAAPSLDGETCRRLGQAVPTAHGLTFRCSIGQTTYAVTSAATGDATQAFETRTTITPLQGRDAGVQQTLRYLRLGDCPAGWSVGDATNQRGELVHDAVSPLDDTPSP